MRLHRGLSLATLALLFLGATSVRADFQIDDFGTTQDIQVKGTPAGAKSAASGVAAPDVVGGARYMTVTRTSLNTSSIEADINGSDPSRLDFTSSSNGVGNVVLKYDGSASATLNATGLGGVDITQGGANDAFRVTGFSSVGLNATVTVYTDATHFSTGTLFVTGTGNTPNYGTDYDYDVTFANFVGNATLTNIGAIVVTFDNEFTGGKGTSANVHDIFFGKAVPEPASFALVGLGLFTTGIVTYRRRRAAQ